MEAVEKLKCFHFFPNYGEKHGEIVLFLPDFHVFPTRRFVVQQQCITVAQQEHTMRYPTVMGAHVKKLVGLLATQKVQYANAAFSKVPGQSRNHSMRQKHQNTVGSTYEELNSAFLLTLSFSVKSTIQTQKIEP